MGVLARYEHETVGNRTAMVTYQGRTEYQYDAAGRVTGKSTADDSVTYTYDGFSRLTGVAMENESGVAYGYDALGRKVVRTETAWADHNGKAWGLQKEPGEKAAPATEGKGEDGAKSDNGKGNDKSARSDEAASTEITCPEGTVPVEVHGSGNGNKPEKPEKALKKVTETTRYLYDGLSRAVTNEYGENGQSVAQYYRSYRDIVARKQFGLKGLINPSSEPTMPMAGGLKYYSPDLRGSVSTLTDPQGQVAEQYRYDAFGGLFTGVTAPYNTSGLTGHDFDPVAGLVDMKARWYSPQTGRFMTPDTWRGVPTEPWTQNRYAMK